MIERTQKRPLLRLLALSVGLVLLLWPSPSRAVPVTGICDNDLPGRCAKSVDLVGNLLTITLTNTSPAANGGFIVADAFNLEGAATITAFSTTNSHFRLFPGLNSTGGSFNVAPFGTREFVVSTAPVGNPQPFEGGASPNDGIGVGSSATFTFTLGGNFSGVTIANVFSSELVRFKGFNTQPDSDKDQTTPVPEPSSLLLLGSGLIGLGAYGRKRLKAIAS